MEFQSANNVIDSISKDADFGIILSYVSDKRIISKLRKKTTQFMLLVDDAEDYILDDSVDYLVISSKKLYNLDHGRAFHPKIYLFGERISETDYVIKYLVGSCNATFKGLNSNIEFFYHSQCIIENTTPFELFSIISEGKFAPSIIDEMKFHEDINGISKSILHFISRLVYETSGNYLHSISQGNKTKSDPHRSATKFLHSLDKNTLYSEFKKNLNVLASNCIHSCSINIISPYMDERIIYELINTLKEKTKKTKKKINIKLLSNFPPDFGNLYSNSSFVNFNDIQITEENIDFEFKYWTRQSTLQSSQIFDDEKYKDVKNRFLHGKLISGENDINDFFCLIGSPNFTTAALNASPHRNIECGILLKGEKNSDDLNKIFQIIWNSAEKPTETMIDQLNRWTDEIDDIQNKSNWIDAQDLFSENIEINMIRENQNSDKIVDLNHIQDYKIEVTIKNELLKDEIQDIRILYLSDDAKNKWEHSNIKIDDKYYFDIKPIKHILNSCRVYYKIIIKTKLLRQVIIKRKDDIKNKINQNIQELKYYDKRKKRYMNYSDKDIKNDYEELCLRTYYKKAYDISLKWKSFSICKTRPKLIPSIVKKCKNSICFKVEEIREKNHANIIHNSVDISLISDSSYFKSTKISYLKSNKPFNSEYYYLSDSTIPENIKLKIEYLDEDSKYRNRATNYQYYNIRNCEKECDFKSNAKEFVDFCSKIQYRYEPSTDYLFDRAPFSLIYKLPINSYISQLLSHIEVQCTVHHYGPYKHQITNIPLGNNNDSLIIDFDPQILLSDTIINRNQYKMAQIELKMTMVDKTGWRYEFASDYNEIINTSQYLTRLYNNIWMKCSESVLQKNVAKKDLLTIIYNGLILAGKTKVKSVNQLLNDYQWKFDMTGEIGHGESKGFILSDKHYTTILFEISNYLMDLLYQKYKSGTNRPQISLEVFKNELKPILNENMEKINITFENKKRLFPYDLIEKIIS